MSRDRMKAYWDPKLPNRLSRIARTVDELRAVTDTFVEQLDLVDSQEVRGLLEKHIVEVDCIQTQLHCSLASVSTRIRDQGDQSTRINKLTSQLQSLEERPAPYTKAGLSIADVMGIATLDQVTNSRRQSLENELTELLSQCETHHSGGYLSNELKGLRSKAQRHDTMSPTDSTGRNSQDAFPYVVWTEARQEWFEQLKRLRQLLHRPWRLELSSNVAEDLDLAGLKYPEPEKVDENLLEKRMLQLQNYQKSCRILGGQEYDILLQRSMPIRSNCTADGSMLMDEYLQVNALELGTRVMRSEFEVLRLLQAQAEEEHTRLVCEQIGPFVDDEKNLNCLEDVEVCYGVAQFWLRLTHQWIRDSQVILDKTDAISNTINTSEKSASDDTYQLISTENSIALWTDGAEKLERFCEKLRARASKLSRLEETIGSLKGLHSRRPRSLSNLSTLVESHRIQSIGLSCRRTASWSNVVDNFTSSPSFDLFDFCHSSAPTNGVETEIDPVWVSTLCTIPRSAESEDPDTSEISVSSAMARLTTVRKKFCQTIGSRFAKIQTNTKVVGLQKLGKLLEKLETASSMDALHGPPSSDVECHLAATLNSLSDALEQTTTWFAEAHGEETDIAESSSTIVQTQNTHLCQLNSLRKDLSDLAIEMQSSISCPTLLRQSSMNTLTKESRDDTEERTHPYNWNRGDQDSSSRYLKSRILESRQHLHRAVQELNTHVMSVSSDSWCHPDSEAIELPGMPDRIPTENCVSSYRDFAAYLEVEITQNAACIEIEEDSISSRRPIQIKHLLDLMWSKLHDHLKVIVQLEETNQNTAGVQAVRLMVSDYSEPYATHDPSGNLLKMSSESLSRLRRLLDDDKIQNEEMGFSSKLCIEVTLFQTVCALLDAVLSNPAWNFLQRFENAAVERLLLLEFIHELLGLNTTSTLEEIQNTDSQDLLEQILESLDKVIGLCDTFVNHTAEGSETFVFPGLMPLPALFHRTMKKLAERHSAVKDFHTLVETDSQTEVRLAVLTMTCSQLRRFCTSVKECMSSRKVSSTKHPCRLAWQPYSTTEDMTTRVAYLSDCLVQIMNLVRQLMRTPIRSMEHLAEQHQNCMMISSKLAWDVVKATCLCCSVGSVLQDEQELSQCRLSIDHSNVLPKAINNLINRMVIRSGKVYGLQQWWEQLSQQTQCFNEATSKLCDQLPGYPVELAPMIHLTFIEWMNEELTTSHQTSGLPSPSSVVHRMLSSSQALDQILKQQDLIRGFVWRLWELDGIGDELIIQLRRFHSHLATFEPLFPVRDSFHLINWNARFSAEWTRLIRWTKDLFVELTECIHSVRWLEDRTIMFETKVKSSQRWLPQNSEMCVDQETDVEALNSKLKHLELIYSEVTGSQATQLEYSDSGILLPTSSVETHSLLDILAGKRDQAYTMHNSLKRALEERMSELCGSLATLVEDPEIDSFSLLQRWFLIHLTNMDQQQPGNQLIDKIDRLRGNLHIWKNAYERLNRRLPVLVQFLKVHTSTTKEALYRLHETWFALMEVAEGARERLLAKCIRYEELQRHIRLLEYEAEEFCRYNQSGDLLQYSDKRDYLMQYCLAVQKRKRERLAELFSRLDKLKEEVTLFATDTLRFTLPAYETCEQHVVEYQMNLLDLPGQVQRIQDKLNELNLDLSMNEDSVDEWDQLNQQQLQLFHGVGELEFLIQCAFAHHPIAITEKEKANYFGCLLNSVGFLQQKISERMRVWFAAMETGCSPWRACGTLDFYSQYMAKCQHFIDQLAKLKSANLIHSQMHQFLLHRMALCEASRVRVVERAEAAQVHLCNMMQQTRILMRGCLVSQRVLEFCQRKSVTDLAGRYNEDGSCNPKPGITDVFDFLADYHVLSNLSGEMGLEKKGRDADGPKDAPGLDEWCALQLDRVQQQICQTRDLVGLVVMHKQQQRLRWAQTQHIIGNMNNQLHKPSTSLTLRMKLLSVLIQLNPYLSPLSMARWLENCPDRPLATSCNREDGVSFFDRLFRLGNALKSIDEQREPQVSGPQEVIVSPEVVDTGDWNLSSIVDAYSKQMTIWPQILSCTKLAIKMVVHGDNCAAKHLLPLLSRLLDVNNRLFQCTTVVENILEQWFHFLYLRSQVSNQILDNELERFRTRLEDKNVKTFEADGSIADQLKMLEGYEASFGQLCNLDEYILIPPSSTEDGHPRLFSDPVCVRWRLQQKLITESSEAGECYRAHLTRIDAKILDAFGLLRDLTIATHDLSKRDTEMLQEHSNVLRESWVLVKELYTGFGHAEASDRATHISTSYPVVFGVQLTLVDLLLLWCNILNTTLHQTVLSKQQFVEMRCGLRAMLDKLSIVPGSGCNALSVLPDPTALFPFTSNRNHIEGISVPNLGWMLTQTELQSARFQERIDYELSRNLGWIKLLSLAASDRNTRMDLSVLTDTARRVRSERAALLCYSSYEKKRSRIANGVLQQARLLLPQIHRQLDRYQHHARISNTSLLQQNGLQLLLKRTFMQYLRTGLLRMPSLTGSAEIYQDFAVRLESAFERSILELLKITRLGRQSTPVTISKSDSCSNLDVNWSSPIDDWLRRIDAMESSKEENLVECIPEWLTDIKQMLAESSTVKVEQISENHGNPSEKLQRRRRRGPSPGKIRVGLQNKLEQVVTKLRSLLRRGSEISSRLRHNQDWKSSIDHLTRMGRTTLAKRMRRDQIKKLRVLQDLLLEFEQVERDWVKRIWMSGGNIDIEITVLAQRLKSIMNFGHSLCVKLEQELSMVIQEDNLPSHDWDNSIHSSDTKSCTLCSAIAEFDESPLIFHHIPNDRLEHVQTPTVNRTQQPVCTVLSPAENSWPFESMRQYHSLDEYLPDHELFEEEETQSLCCDDIGNDSCIQIQAPAVYEPEQLQPTDYNRCPGTKRLPHFKDSTSERTGGREWSHQTSTISTQVSEEELVRQLRALCAQANRRATELIAITVDEPEFLSASCDQLRTFLGQLEAYNFRVHTLSSLNSARSAADEKPLISGEWTRTLKATRTWLCELQKAFATSKGLEQLISEFQQHMKETELSVHPTRYSSTSTTSLVRGFDHEREHIRNKFNRREEGLPHVPTTVRLLRVIRFRLSEWLAHFNLLLLTPETLEVLPAIAALNPLPQTDEMIGSQLVCLRSCFGGLLDDAERLLAQWSVRCRQHLGVGRNKEREQELTPTVFSTPRRTGCDSLDTSFERPLASEVRHRYVSTAGSTQLFHRGDPDSMMTSDTDDNIEELVSVTSRSSVSPVSDASEDLINLEQATDTSWASELTPTRSLARSDHTLRGMSRGQNIYSRHSTPLLRIEPIPTTRLVPSGMSREPVSLDDFRNEQVVDKPDDEEQCSTLSTLKESSDVCAPATFEPSEPVHSLVPSTQSINDPEKVQQPRFLPLIQFIKSTAIFRRSVELLATFSRTVISENRFDPHQPGQYDTNFKHSPNFTRSFGESIPEPPGYYVQPMEDKFFRLQLTSSKNVHRFRFIPPRLQNFSLIILLTLLLLFALPLFCYWLHVVPYFGSDCVYTSPWSGGPASVVSGHAFAKSWPNNAPPS